MPDPDNQRLSCRERLNAGEVSRLFAGSSSARSKYFVVRAALNGLDYTRIAPIASRKAGKANKRNRIKRRIRAAFRENKYKLPQGYDLAIIALYGVITADYTELVRSLEDAAERACNLCNKDAGQSGNADNKVSVPEGNQSDDA